MKSCAQPFPKLRPVDARPVSHEGKSYFVLRDPLQLSDKILLIPQALGPLLALCDGTREDAGALVAAMALRFGVRIGTDIVEQVIAALDDALLLDNARLERAQADALETYRRAPMRKPALAGLSYPEDPDKLRGLLQGFVEMAGDDPSSNARPEVRGLVSPHIDYARGGPVYARVWTRAAEMAKFADLAVIFGTDHYGGNAQITLTRQHYSTPFGVLPTPREIVDTLAESIDPVSATAGELAHRGEHSIELAAVWLHFIRDGIPCDVVPILCGSFGEFIRGQSEAQTDPKLCGLIDALNHATRGRRVLVIAAADLAHVGPAFGGPPVGTAGREALKGADDELIDRICAGDAEGFLGAIKRVEDRNNVCGVSPIYLALRMLAGAAGESLAYDRCPADEANTSLVSICGVVLG
jgi:AmmeMemoRadiSam system protein B